MSNTSSVVDMSSHEKMLESVVNLVAQCPINNDHRWPYLPGQFAHIMTIIGPASSGSAVCISLKREHDRKAGACEPVDAQCSMTASMDPGTLIASTSSIKPTIPRVSYGPTKRAYETEVTLIPSGVGGTSEASSVNGTKNVVMWVKKIVL